jgi:hypothetical protein
MSKTVEKRATVETAYGQTLAEPVKFSYSFVELEKGDEIPATEMPDSDDLRSFVNQKRNAKARSAAQNEALSNAGIVKPTLEDADVRFATMVKVLKAAGNTQEQAEQMAHQVLGV